MGSYVDHSINFPCFDLLLEFSSQGILIFRTFLTWTLILIYIRNLHHYSRMCFSWSNFAWNRNISVINLFSNTRDLIVYFSSIYLSICCLFFAIHLILCQNYCLTTFILLVLGPYLLDDLIGTSVFNFVFGQAIKVVGFFLPIIKYLWLIPPLNSGMA